MTKKNPNDGATTAQRRSRKSAPSPCLDPKGDGDGASSVVALPHGGATTEHDGALEPAPDLRVQAGFSRKGSSQLGRPSEFKPEYVMQAQKLCELGATDPELADFFSVHPGTIARWKIEYPAFCEATKIGKAPTDDRVERRLYERAIGYTWIEQQAIKVKTGEDVEEVQIVEVERRVPPDTTAAIFWLKNRRRTEWRDVHQIEGQGGAAFVGIQIVTRDGKVEQIELSSEQPALPGKDERTKR
jgi:hypothetical protein